MLLVAVTIVAICGYGLLEMVGREAFATPYKRDIPDGAPVVHEGQVTSYTVAKSGGHLILDVNGVVVFIPGDIAGEMRVKKGDTIRVIGIVQSYQGKKEILIENPKDLIIRQIGIAPDGRQSGTAS